MSLKDSSQYFRITLTSQLMAWGSISTKKKVSISHLISLCFLRAQSQVFKRKWVTPTHILNFILLWWFGKKFVSYFTNFIYVLRVLLYESFLCSSFSFLLFYRFLATILNIEMSDNDFLEYEKIFDSINMWVIFFAMIVFFLLFLCVWWNVFSVTDCVFRRIANPFYHVEHL